ncbi:MAG: hypothetical protein ACREBC_36065 [Pyrinomonadaceae bacterium]
MATLDNQAPILLKQAKNVGAFDSICLVLLLQIAAFGEISSRNQPSEAEKDSGQPDKIVATEKVTEADQVYSQRENLSFSDYLPEYKDAVDKANKLLEEMDRNASR